MWISSWLRSLKYNKNNKNSQGTKKVFYIFWKMWKKSLLIYEKWFYRLRNYGFFIIDNFRF